MNIDVNYLAVFIAGIISMITGFAWYSPFLFGKPWMKVMGYTSGSMKEAQKAMGKLYGLSFVLTLVTAFVLAHVMSLSKAFYGTSEVSTGLSTAFWMWLGFVMPVQMTGVMFAKEKWPLFGINTGYQLVSMLLMGLTMGLLG